MPTRRLLLSKTRLDAALLENVFQLCKDSGFVAYPSIGQTESAIMIQEKVVNCFQTKANPVRMDKYFFE